MRINDLEKFKENLEQIALREENIIRKMQGEKDEVRLPPLYPANSITNLTCNPNHNSTHLESSQTRDFDLTSAIKRV